MLTIQDNIPDAFYTVHANELYTVFNNPTLIHLQGRKPNPLFISVLLHGNEDTGLVALQRLLSEYKEKELPRSLSVFIGNIQAAKHGLRRLDDQLDYNRVWPSDIPGKTKEHHMMQQVVDEMRQRHVFASVDVHNNTGLNPHYACVNNLDTQFLQLATLFSRTVVYFTRPIGVQAMAFAPMCPSVILECGKVEKQHGVDHAYEYLNACLHLNEIPTHAVAEHDIHLFHTKAIVKIPPHIEFGFGDDCNEKHICFADDLDHLNFRELPEGTMLGTVKSDDDFQLDVCDEHDKQVYDRYFRITDGELQTARPLMPSMLSLDSHVIRQDCLCYLMERVSVDQIPK